MRRGHRARSLGNNFAPGAKARIDHASRAQTIQRRSIFRQTFRLPPDGHIPVQTQPAQILINRGFKLRAVARGVKIINAQKKLTTCLARQIMRHNRRNSMPNMQQACRAGRKPGVYGVLKGGRIRQMILSMQGRRSGRQIRS